MRIGIEAMLDFFLLILWKYSHDTHGIGIGTGNGRGNKNFFDL